MSDHDIVKRLAKEMGDAGYCNYEACERYLWAAYDAGKALRICPICGHDEADEIDNRTHPAATPGQCPTCESHERGFRGSVMWNGSWQDCTDPWHASEESSWEAIADRLKGQVYKWQAENERLREALRQAITMVTHLKLCLDKSDQPLVENAIQGWLALAARES